MKRVKPHLTVDLTTAHQKLDIMISEGLKMVHESIASMEAMRSAQRKYHAWNSGVFQELKALFSHTDIAVEYAASPLKIGRIFFVDTSLSEIKAKHYRIVREKVEKLHSIKASLDLLALRTPSQCDIILLHSEPSSVADAVLTLLHDNLLKPIILKEYAHAGQTLIEQIQDDPRIRYAIAILTPDLHPSVATLHRADQNLILELGIFIGKLGRENVSAVIAPNLDLPADFHDFQYIDFDTEEAWKTKLSSELRQAGYEVK
jgi:predicted nucleotide-binding protein